ncbi:Serine/threonine-protein kinase smu1 [Thoreauomyces humboldtii]|nr:Serine/threonine-protein kinase smu1 [Thoreauomyces humboldtii]
MSSTSLLEIEAADVIRLMQQFLKENNLPKTLQALQDETTVTLNTVDNMEAFTADILAGRWDMVFSTITQLKISQKKLVDLYEQVTLELIELREISAARSLLRQTDPMQFLKDHYPDRYLHLEHLLSQTVFDATEAYLPFEGATKASRRAQIAQALSSEVTVVPPSRLLSLLGQSLKWQASQGMLEPDAPYDLFRGAAPLATSGEDQPPTECYNSIKFPKKAHAECVVFSPDGQCLATGSVDGFIEIWNYVTGKLRKDFKYQAEDSMMLMETPVLSLCFSPDSQHLASGSQDGLIKIWKLSSGQCIRRFPAAHSQGVTSLSFSKDGTQVLSSSFDQTLRIHGLKSGKMVKEFRGHGSFVNGVVWGGDGGSRVISGSSDGSMRIWDTKSTNCLLTVHLHEGQVVTSGVHSPTVNAVMPMPRTLDRFLVCNKSSYVYLVNIKGQVVKSFTPTVNAGTPVTASHYVCVTTSPRGDYVYCATESNHVHVYHSESGKMVTSFKASEAEMIGLAHHPVSNIMAAYSDDGIVSLWKA